MNTLGMGLLIGLFTFGLQAADQGPKIDLLGNAELSILGQNDEADYQSQKQKLIEQINQNWKNSHKQIDLIKRAIIDGHNPNQWIIDTDDGTGKPIHVSVRSFVARLGDTALLYLLKNVIRKNGSYTCRDGYARGGTKLNFAWDDSCFSLYPLLSFNDSDSAKMSVLSDRVAGYIFDYPKLMLIQALAGQTKHCFSKNALNYLVSEAWKGTISIQFSGGGNVYEVIRNFERAATIIIKFGHSLDYREEVVKGQPKPTEFDGITFRDGLKKLKSRLQSKGVGTIQFEQAIQKFKKAEEEYNQTRSGLTQLLHRRFFRGPGSVIESYVDGDVLCVSMAQELASVRAEMQAKLAAYAREYQPEIDQAREQHRQVLWERGAPERRAREVQVVQRQLMQGDRNQDFLDMDDRTLRYGAEEEFDAWTNSMQEGSGPHGGASSSSSGGSNGFHQLSLAPGRQPQPHGYGNGASSSSSSSQQPQTRVQLQVPVQQPPAGNGSSSSSSFGNQGTKRKFGEDNPFEVNNGAQNPAKRFKKDEPNNGNGSASARLNSATQ